MYICSFLLAPRWCFVFVFVPPCYCPPWPFNPFPLHPPTNIHTLFKSHLKCHSLWETACSDGINHIFHCIPTPLCFGLFYKVISFCILLIYVTHPPQKHMHAHTLLEATYRRPSYVSQHEDEYLLYTLQMPHRCEFYDTTQGLVNNCLFSNSSKNYIPGLDLPFASLVLMSTIIYLSPIGFLIRISNLTCPGDPWSFSLVSLPHLSKQVPFIAPFRPDLTVSLDLPFPHTAYQIH